MSWDIGFIGNALVVVVVAANQQMRNTTNLLIINLALADLLFIVFCVPFTATDYALPFWPFGDVWCKIVQYLVRYFCNLKFTFATIKYVPLNHVLTDERVINLCIKKLPMKCVLYR